MQNDIKQKILFIRTREKQDHLASLTAELAHNKIVRIYFHNGLGVDGYRNIHNMYRDDILAAFDDEQFFKISICGDHVTITTLE